MRHSQEARLASMQKPGLDTGAELAGCLTWSVSEMISGKAQARIPSAAPQFSKRWKKLDAR
jgi:hypothetical protein